MFDFAVCPSKFCMVHVSWTPLTAQKYPRTLQNTKAYSLLKHIAGFTMLETPSGSLSKDQLIMSPQDCTVDCCKSPAAPWALRSPCVLRIARCWPWHPMSPRSPRGSSAAQRFSEPMSPDEAQGRCEMMQRAS